MAKNYDEQKVYAELGKLNPENQYIELQNIIAFVHKNLEAEIQDLQERQNEIQKKLQTINGK